MGRWLQTGRDALLVHRPDRNPALGRCPGHVVGKADRRGYLYPAKQRPGRKTDATVALMIAVGRAMAANGGQPDLGNVLRAPLFA